MYYLENNRPLFMFLKYHLKYLAFFGSCWRVEQFWLFLYSIFWEKRCLVKFNCPSSNDSHEVIRIVNNKKCDHEEFQQAQRYTKSALTFFLASNKFYDERCEQWLIAKPATAIKLSIFQSITSACRKHAKFEMLECEQNEPDSLKSAMP